MAVLHPFPKLWGVVAADRTNSLSEQLPLAEGSSLLPGQAEHRLLEGPGCGIKSKPAGLKLHNSEGYLIPSQSFLWGLAEAFVTAPQFDFAQSYFLVPPHL
jgi:hypothetical protein